MLQKTTIDFLKSLKKNNNKPWFDENRSRYEIAKSDFENLVNNCITDLSKYNLAYETLKPKDCIFRINRDVRFSKDKSPYKTNFGAAFVIGGKKSNLAGIYIHIEPAKCFIGGGVWMPEADSLKKIRQEIDYQWNDFNKIINNKKFKIAFNDLSKDDALINPPKGIDHSNPAIEYLKLKKFVVSKSIKEEILFTSELIKELKENINTIMPFIMFLNKSIQ